jgi:antirestriction protein ArdC
MEGLEMQSGTQLIKRDLRQEVTDAIIAALEKGTAPWQKPWQAGALELPFNPTSGKPYRGGNAILLMLNGSSKGYDDPRWLTYRQAQESGWQVRKAEKGTQIEFWQFPERNGTGGDGFSNQDQPQSDKFVYRVYTVFNAKQIDGMPPHSPRVCQEWEVAQGAEAILQNSGARISHDLADRAFYSRLADSIHLPPKAAFKTAGDYYGTALHELAHDADIRIMPRRPRLRFENRSDRRGPCGIIIEIPGKRAECPRDDTGQQRKWWRPPGPELFP